MPWQSTESLLNDELAATRVLFSSLCYCLVKLNRSCSDEQTDAGEDIEWSDAGNSAIQQFSIQPVCSINVVLASSIDPSDVVGACQLLPI